GLEPGRMSYYAGRATAMGPVGTGVDAATFDKLNPATEANPRPRARDDAAPQSVRRRQVGAYGTTLWRRRGAEVLESELVGRTAQLAQEAALACTPEGKPLFAAHADLPWPQEPHLKLWHAATLLREFRGDAHIAALQRAGLSGLQALVLHSASGEGCKPSVAKKWREWSDEQWAAAEQQLRDRGLVDEDGVITDAGTRLREEVETDTDAMSMPPWAALGESATEQLLTSGRQLSRALAKAGAAPRELFGRD